MALAAFDTHDFVKRLTSAGLAVEVAEVFAKEQSHLIGTIVSKDDLKEHKAANRSDVEHLEERIDSKFDLLRHEIGDLRKDIDAKFVGMDAKFVGMDAKFSGLEERSNAKFDVLRAEMAAIKWGLSIMGAGIIALLVKAFF
jgi:hypothetical protein